MYTNSTLVRKIRTASSLSLSRLGLFLESWMTLTAVSIALKFAPVRTVRRALSQPPPDNQQPATPASANLPTDLLAVYGIALRNHLLRFNCLPRSLALQRLLRRRGIETRLHIGARMTEGRLDGHAWVEVAGQPIMDQPGVASTYPPLTGNPADVRRWI